MALSPEENALVIKEIKKRILNKPNVNPEIASVAVIIMNGFDGARAIFDLHNRGIDGDTIIKTLEGVGFTLPEIEARYRKMHDMAIPEISKLLEGEAEKVKNGKMLERSIVDIEREVEKIRKGVITAVNSEHPIYGNENCGTSEKLRCFDGEFRDNPDYTLAMCDYKEAQIKAKFGKTDAIVLEFMVYDELYTYEGLYRKCTVSSACFKCALKDSTRKEIRKAIDNLVFLGLVEKTFVDDSTTPLYRRKELTDNEVKNRITKAKAHEHSKNMEDRRTNILFR